MLFYAVGDDCVMQRLFHIDYICKIFLQCEFFHDFEVDHERQRIYYIAYIHKVSLQYGLLYVFGD